KIGDLLDEIRQQQPGISDGALSNIMIASFCPVVANDPALNNSQRRARLMDFNTALQDRLAGAAEPSDVRVLVSVPLQPNVLQQLKQAAASQHQALTKWMADTLARQAQGLGGSQ
ncbi:MAG TPA: hypothetical protein VIJ55_01420, partial [Acetobacteraceae bacterium]